VAQLKLEGYQGTLVDLATHLRRRRIDPLSFSATELIRQLRARWRGAEIPSLNEVAEELPVAAWVVRRKGLGLIPGSREEPEPEPAEDVPPWDALPVLTEWLKARAVAAHAWGGVARWPEPAPPLIPDATPWRLLWAWPPGRLPRGRPAPQVVMRTHPLWRRGLRLIHWLSRQPKGGILQDWMTGRTREEQVDVLLVLLSLWARRRVELSQAAPYGPLKVLLIRGGGADGGEHS
jgi:chromatin segregation and condensation protein Rec8/ScpA/Scc1 (kleisin family)